MCPRGGCLQASRVGISTQRQRGVGAIPIFVGHIIVACIKVITLEQLAIVHEAWLPVELVVRDDGWMTTQLAFSGVSLEKSFLPSTLLGIDSNAS